MKTKILENENQEDDSKPIVDEVKTDNSTIKKLREEIKSKNEEIETLKLQNSNELDGIKKELDSLRDNNLINTYGQENLEDVKKLLNAGFDETKIKSMLNKTDDLNNFDNPNNNDIDKIKGEGEVKTEEVKELNEIEEYRLQLSKKT